jgi:hypothetical protein
MSVDGGRRTGRAILQSPILADFGLTEIAHSTPSYGTNMDDEDGTNDTNGTT